MSTNLHDFFVRKLPVKWIVIILVCTLYFEQGLLVHEWNVSLTNSIWFAEGWTMNSLFYLISIPTMIIIILIWRYLYLVMAIDFFYISVLRVPFLFLSCTWIKSKFYPINRPAVYWIWSYGLDELQPRIDSDSKCNAGYERTRWNT